MRDYKAELPPKLANKLIAVWDRGTKLKRAGRASDDSTRILSENFQTSKLNQSTRVVKIDVYYTIRPFKRNPGTKVD